MKWLFVVGFVGKFLRLVAPIHELGHVIFAFITLSPARMSWASTAIRDPNLLSAGGGYLFELAVWAVIYMLAYEKGKGWFAYGVVWATVVEALISYDLNRMVEMGGDRTMLSVIWVGYCLSWCYLIRKHRETILEMRRAYERRVPAKAR